MFLETSRHFDLSTRSLGLAMSSFTGTAQEAGAGGRYGAVDIPVHGSLMGRFLYLYGFLHFSFGPLWLSG